MKQTIKVTELAALSNLTTRRLRQLAEEAKLPPIKRGSMPMPEAMRMLFAHYQKVPEEMTAKRMLSLTLEIEKKQHALDLQKGRYIDREVANFTVTKASIEYHRIVKRHIEADSSEEAARKIITNIERECSQIAREIPGEIKTEKTNEEEKNQTDSRAGVQADCAPVHQSNLRQETGGEDKGSR